MPQTGTKVCRKCGQKKPVTEFRTFRKYGSKDREYRRSWCRDCDLQYTREWRKKHPDYHKEYSRKYHKMEGPDGEPLPDAPKGKKKKKP